MKKDYLLHSHLAKKLYSSVQDFPIYDYHCHLSPKAIAEDLPFSDIGELWLSGDHYKWRLMRAAGIDEKLITGNATYHDKFSAYAKAISLSAGSPLYHWTEMELSVYFGINTPLSEKTAEEIYAKANTVIKDKHYSPRTLLRNSNVHYVATTDDPSDTLEYHQAIANDKTCDIRVVPSFRTDSVFRIDLPGYSDYIKKLSEVSEIEISDLSTLKSALENRLRFFISYGCKFADIGIPIFPTGRKNIEEAESAFKKTLTEQPVSESEFDAFLFELFVFLGQLYQKYNIVMQWHLAVERNVNSKLLDQIGPDSGGDCIGNTIPTGQIASVLNQINVQTGLPKTIIYTLNPSMNDALASVAYSFPNVILGTAWWFCDHKDGIEEMIRVIARTGHVASFLGMLTDSRSFLSYVRHDYFRRIFCNVLANWVISGEFSGDAFKLASLVCGENTKRLCEGNHD